MKRIVLAIAIACAVCACTPKLVIVHVNDTHSHLEPLRGEREGVAGVVERAALIDSIRAEYGAEKVLLLHAGDFDQGTPYFNVFGGMLEAELINALEYDVVTYGNHEFDSGLESLAERAAIIKCDKVCANLDLSPFEVGKYTKPYSIVERGGMKIGVIGLAPVLQGNVATPIASRIPELDPLECCNKYAEYLKNEEKCDLIIALSHLGYEEDQALAKESHNLDLIVGGHSHTFVDDFITVRDADGKGVKIITDGAWGIDLGLVKIY